MDKKFFPSDGSIAIIDDNIKEVLPFFNLLSKEGLGFTYYDGKMKFIPDNPIQKIRLVFLDIQLYPSLNEHTYTENIRHILSKLIGDDNGPYIVIIWSRKEPVYFDSIKEKLETQKYPLRPIAILKLKKRDYISENSNNIIDEHIEDISPKLQSQFTDLDIKFITDVFRNNIPNEISYSIDDLTLNRLELAIQAELEKIKLFHFFTLWEKSLHKSYQKTLDSLLKTFEYNTEWETNTKHLLYSMAHAISGNNVENFSTNEILLNAIKLLNSSFIENINTDFIIKEKISDFLKISSSNNYLEFKVKEKLIKIVHANESEYQLFIDNIQKGKNKKITKLLTNRLNEDEKESVKKAICLFRKKTPSINTNLHIDVFPQTTIAPGNIYRREVKGKNIRKYLSNYFKKEKINEKKDGKYIVTLEELKRVKFIELEITPVCDYAQKKYLKHRFISGIIFPTEFEIEKDYTKEFNGFNYYEVIPEIMLKNEYYRIVFDFRLLKTKFLNEIQEYDKAIFKIKSELFTDILSNLSKYINRPGVTFLV